LYQASYALTSNVEVIPNKILKKSKYLRNKQLEQAKRPQHKYFKVYITTSAVLNSRAKIVKRRGGNAPFFGDLCLFMQTFA
jgi:uncharacterized protein with gpF-like domain